MQGVREIYDHGQWKIMTPYGLFVPDYQLTSSHYAGLLGEEEVVVKVYKALVGMEEDNELFDESEKLQTLDKFPFVIRNKGFWWVEHFLVSYVMLAKEKALGNLVDLALEKAHQSWQEKLFYLEQVFLSVVALKENAHAYLLDIKLENFFFFEGYVVKVGDLESLYFLNRLEDCRQFFYRNEIKVPHSQGYVSKHSFSLFKEQLKNGSLPSLEIIEKEMVYALGELFHRFLFLTPSEGKSAHPLLHKMLDDNPSRRPFLDQVALLFHR